MYVIVKNSSKRFKPHFNRSLDKYYHTKDDYLGDMKKMGLEPYRGEQSRPEPRKYVPSKWAHEIVRTIEHNTDKDGNVQLGTVAREEIARKGGIVNRDVSGLNIDKGGIQ